MGAQQTCRCGRDSVNADDADSDSPVVPVLDLPAGRASEPVVEPGWGGGAAASCPPAAEGRRPLPAQDRAPQPSSSAPQEAALAPEATGGSAAALEGGPVAAAAAALPEAPAERRRARPARREDGVTGAAKAGRQRKGVGAKATAAVSTTAAGDAKELDLARNQECPGMQMVAKVEKKGLTPLQKVKKRREEEDRKAKEMGGLVDDILAGKFKGEGTGKQPAGDMRIKMPTPYERNLTRKIILEGFRSEYEKLSKRKAEISEVTEQKIMQYSEKEVEGLEIKEGHRSMPRPQNVKLPKDFRKPVGTLTLETLNAYSCDNPRMLISVYGNIFDVSDRPDKYGKTGPYSWMTGNDISWGFVSGKDIPEEINKFYDMWKIAPAQLQQKKLTGLLAWVAFYEFEYGGSVGLLQEYENEAGLRGPPMEEVEECCVM